MSDLNARGPLLKIPLYCTGGDEKKSKYSKQNYTPEGICKIENPECCTTLIFEK